MKITLKTILVVLIFCLAGCGAIADRNRLSDEQVVTGLKNTIIPEVNFRSAYLYAAVRFLEDEWATLYMQHDLKHNLHIVLICNTNNSVDRGTCEPDSIFEDIDVLRKSRPVTVMVEHISFYDILNSICELSDTKWSIRESTIYIAENDKNQAGSTSAWYKKVGAENVSKDSGNEVSDVVAKDISIKKFTRPLTREDAYEILLKTDTFAGDAVGFSGEMSVQVHAFNIILDQPVALDAFRDLFNRGRKPGKLYALCGFYILDKKEFDVHKELMLKDGGDVTIYSGCEIGREPVSWVMESITNGVMPKTFRWDSFDYEMQMQNREKNASDKEKHSDYKTTSH